MAAVCGRPGLAEVTDRGEGLHGQYLAGCDLSRSDRQRNFGLRCLFCKRMALRNRKDHFVLQNLLIIKGSLEVIWVFVYDRKVVLLPVYPLKERRLFQIDQLYICIRVFHLEPVDRCIEVKLADDRQSEHPYMPFPLRGEPARSHPHVIHLLERGDSFRKKLSASLRQSNLPPAPVKQFCPKFFFQAQDLPADSRLGNIQNFVARIPVTSTLRVRRATRGRSALNNFT